MGAEGRWRKGWVGGHGVFRVFGLAALGQSSECTPPHEPLARVGGEGLA